MRFKEIKHKEVERKLQGDIRIEKGYRQSEADISPETMKAFWDLFWEDMMEEKKND